MSIFEIVLGLGGVGGIISLITMPFVMKEAKAKAIGAEQNNAMQVAEGWRQIADERQEEIECKNKTIECLNIKVDELYTVNSQWRDKYNECKEEISSLKIEKATNSVKMCDVRNCLTRNPPTGY